MERLGQTISPQKANYRICYTYIGDIMKKIKVDNLELVLENTRLSVLRTKYFSTYAESYLEDICHDITLSCESCIFYKEEKCDYQNWNPGLKKGRQC
jgi:hypothetical protein